MDKDKIQKIKRVSDMQCSAHANLRDRFHRYAFILDITIIALSTWLVALVFIEPQINFSITPFGLSPNLWIGFLAIFTFFLSIVQVKVNWKARADSHERSVIMHADVKRECVFLLGVENIKPDDPRLQRMLVRHEIAAKTTMPIPEKEFLKQKQKHLIKVELSRYLGKYPSASIFIASKKIWWRDNVKKKEGKNIDT